MKPLILKLEIEIPPVGTPERDAFYRQTVAELLGLELPTRRPTAPAVRPFAEGLDPDEPTDVNRADLDDADRRPARSGEPPADGRELLGWIKSHGGDATQKRAVAIARSRGYGTMLVKLTADQVADVFHELGKPARGQQRWGS